MKKIVLIYLVVFFQKAQGQNRILLKAEQLFKPEGTKEVVQIKLPWGNWGKKVVAVYKDGTKEFFNKKDIWGIRRSNKNEVLRFYNGMTFKIVDTNIIILYQTYSPHPVYYFSEFLDSRAFPFDRKKVMSALDEDKLVQLYKKSYLLRRLLL